MLYAEILLTARNNIYREYIHGEERTVKFWISTFCSWSENTVDANLTRIILKSEGHRWDYPVTNDQFLKIVSRTLTKLENGTIAL